MGINNHNMKKIQPGGLKVRAALLLIQTILPFGLFMAMTRENILIMWLIGFLFTLSIGVLVWLG